MRGLFCRTEGRSARATHGQIVCVLAAARMEDAATFRETAEGLFLRVRGAGMVLDTIRVLFPQIGKTFAELNGGRKNRNTVTAVGRS